MPNKVNDWQGGFAPFGFSWQADKDPTGKSIYHVHAGPFAQKITRSFKDVACLLASQDYNIIIDDVAFGDVEIQDWKSRLKNYHALYVGVKAPLDILEQRERDRGDRFLGSARAQYFTVHENALYDLELDSHLDSLEGSVAKIMQALAEKWT
jgi:chloramphenicol 3-O phosphotransferase